MLASNNGGEWNAMKFIKTTSDPNVLLLKDTFHVTDMLVDSSRYDPQISDVKLTAGSTNKVGFYTNYPTDLSTFKKASNTDAIVFQSGTNTRWYIMKMNFFETKQDAENDTNQKWARKLVYDSNTSSWSVNASGHPVDVTTISSNDVNYRSYAFLHSVTDGDWSAVKWWWDPYGNTSLQIIH